MLFYDEATNVYLSFDLGHIIGSCIKQYHIALLLSLFRKSITRPCDICRLHTIRAFHQGRSLIRVLGTMPNLQDNLDFPQIEISAVEIGLSWRQRGDFSGNFHVEDVVSGMWHSGENDEERHNCCN